MMMIRPVVCRRGFAAPLRFSAVNTTGSNTAAEATPDVGASTTAAAAAGLALDADVEAGTAGGDGGASSPAQSSPWVRFCCTRRKTCSTERYHLPTPMAHASVHFFLRFFCVLRKIPHSVKRFSKRDCSTAYSSII